MTSFNLFKPISFNKTIFVHEFQNKIVPAPIFLCMDHWVQTDSTLFYIRLTVVCRIGSSVVTDHLTVRFDWNRKNKKTGLCSNPS